MFSRERVSVTNVKSEGRYLLFLFAFDLCDL